MRNLDEPSLTMGPLKDGGLFVLWNSIIAAADACRSHDDGNETQESNSYQLQEEIGHDKCMY